MVVRHGIIRSTSRIMRAVLKAILARRKAANTSKTVNNPVAIVDQQTGSIEFLYCVNYARCFSMRSTDDGLTWSKPVEITSSFEPFREKYIGNALPPALATEFS